MTAAEAAHRLYYAICASMLWLDKDQQRGTLNRLLWERLRGIAYQGWES